MQCHRWRCHTLSCVTSSIQNSGPLKTTYKMISRLLDIRCIWNVSVYRLESYCQMLENNLKFKTLKACWILSIKVHSVWTHVKDFIMKKDETHIWNFREQDGVLEITVSKTQHVRAGERTVQVGRTCDGILLRMELTPQMLTLCLFP